MLRKTTEISAIIIGLLGVFGIIFGGVLLGKNKNVTSDSGDLIKASFGIMLGLGFILLIISLVGIFAWWKRHNCMLGVYIALLTVVVTCSIIVFAISAGLLSEVNDSKDDKACEKKDFLIYSRKVYEKGYGVLCSSNCKCQVQQSYLSGSQQLSLNWSSSSGATRAQDCNTYTSSIDFKIPSDIGNVNDLSKLLGNIEDYFNCSGFCNKYPFYVFSNSYKSQPKNKDCKVEVLDFLDSKLSSLSAGALAVMIISILGCIFSCSLCCHKEKRDGIPYYDDYERTNMKTNKNTYYR